MSLLHNGKTVHGHGLVGVLFAVPRAVDVSWFWSVLSLFVD